MTTDLPAITRLYQLCEPLESLHPGDPRWVDFDPVRGDENVVALYARSLRRAAADRPDFKLFTGHRGVGKTSELFRLQNILEAPGDGQPGFVVVYCDVGDRLDVNDLDFPDLLVFVLASPKVHTVYTVPISLIYSPRFGQLQQAVGEHNVPLSMIRLRPGWNADISDDSPGMAKMREMVERRCCEAGTSLDAAFDGLATLNHLCRMSGGHPRHLMMFLQAACNELDDLPITRTAAEKAVRKYANALLREVPDADWDKLAVFATPQRDIPKDEPHQQMLFLLFVFEYMDGDIWYEINPVLRTLERFRP
ncbi:hypothetical protein [Thiohalocapsa sp. ML1]|uniref:hypothetical protein n=1 Tax=Thiohalocapsa sp. ML1 TaxID=1431688 RepID=UPI0012E331CE|nr:hypothetical protein [Thiohalocapsa sp. ML1]